MCLCYQAV